MLKLNTQELKQIEKLKKKVHKQYPGAYLVELGSGYYTILQEQEDLLPKDILLEWCVPPVNNPISAWEAALTGAKVNQNLNRTHPLRIEGMNLEDKIARVEARRMRTETGKESRKTKEYGIYI
jgi:hypothetical protein